MGAGAPKTGFSLRTNPILPLNGEPTASIVNLRHANPA